MGNLDHGRVVNYRNSLAWVIVLALIAVLVWGVILRPLDRTITGWSESTTTTTIGQEVSE